MRYFVIHKWKNKARSFFITHKNLTLKTTSKITSQISYKYLTPMDWRLSKNFVKILPMIVMIESAKVLKINRICHQSLSCVSNRRLLGWLLTNTLPTKNRKKIYHPFSTKSYPKKNFQKKNKLFKQILWLKLAKLLIWTKKLKKVNT